MTTQGDVSSDGNVRELQEIDSNTGPPEAKPPAGAKPGRNRPEPEDRYSRLRANFPPILTTAQVAELLDLNPRTVLNMAGDGRLPASRLPGSRKFHFLLEDIISTLEANRVAD